MSAADQIQERPRRGPAPEAAVFDCIPGRYAQALAPTTEADAVGVLGSLVTGLSGMIGPLPRMQIGDSDHPLLIWTLLCGATAAGRKGTAASVAKRVLARADPAFWRVNTLSGLSSAEGLIAAVADPDPDGLPPAPTGDQDKRRLVIESEYGSVLNRARREGNTLSATLRQAWDGDNLRVQTKTPMVATSPHVAITGHVSPTEFRKGISASDLAGGSYNRFVLLHVERSQRLPEGGGAAEEVVDELANDVRARLEAGRRPSVLRRSSSARSRWAHLYDELCDLEDQDDIAPWVSRAVPYTLRLAGLYAVLDGQLEIHAQHLDAAAALVRYGIQSARYITQGAQPASDAERVAQLIRRHGADGITRSAILRGLGLTRGDLEIALGDVLRRPGFQQQSQSTGGRSATRYRYQRPNAALALSLVTEDRDAAPISDQCVLRVERGHAE